MQIKKRDGTIVPFDSDKIKSAVLKALEAVGLPAESLSDKVRKDVVKTLDGKETTTVEEVQDLVETALMKRSLTKAAKEYILYRDKRARVRDAMHVRRSAARSQSVTDKSMLITSSESDQLIDWDRKSIVKRLMDAFPEIDLEKAVVVAKRVEDCIISTGLKTVNNGLVRELTNNILKDMGFSEQLTDSDNYMVPKEFVSGLIESKVNENSNITTNNPEAVNQSIAEYVLKQFALDKVFSEEVKQMHCSNMLYLHDLGFPVRGYCGSHSIEYIKKYGLKGLNNLGTTSNPAKSASVLTGHLNTFLASMQAYYAGALGLGYINIFYAPLLLGMDKTQLHQIAQELVFNGSQNAFSRGGQTLFLDFNIHTGVPSYLCNVPAIGAGGKYMFLPNGKDKKDWVPLIESTFADEWCLELPAEYTEEHTKCLVFEEDKDGLRHDENPYGRVLTYGDFEEEAQAFAHALLDVWGEGDANGHVFEFPKCDFHVSAETFTDPKQHEVYLHACELAAKNGSTYFVFDRDSVSLSSCCRLRQTIDDMSIIKHPEHLRTLGLQNVTINIPQAAYRAKHAGKGDLNGIIEEIDKVMDVAVKAHLQKKAFLESIMTPGHPMAQVGKLANDGRPYMELNKAMYIIGLIGVNDAVHYLLGKEMHESDEAMDMALRITCHMYLKCKEYTSQYGLAFKLEESPAESAARKMAKSDLVNWHDDAVQVYKGGDEDHAYYTNSIHLSADAPVDLITRIEAQAKFNSVIEAGAMMHAFLGEQSPSAEAIDKLVVKVFQRTQAAQLTFSPEFTYCNKCGKMTRGIKTKCEHCGSTDVYGETRIVGYFSRVSNFNLSKLAELRARQHGQYKVDEASITQ